MIEDIINSQNAHIPKSYNVFKKHLGVSKFVYGDTLVKDKQITKNKLMVLLWSREVGQLAEAKISNSLEPHKECSLWY